ncbi:hypothetical protein EON66_01445 [archaeon]|nr:MAG: hypothetical protein EON66_01445 [archaeon]
MVCVAAVAAPPFVNVALRNSPSQMASALRFARPVAAALHAAATPVVAPTAAARRCIASSVRAAGSTTSSSAPSSAVRVAVPKEVYGAPYTNSIAFKAGAGAAAELSITAPQWPAVQLTLTPDQTLGEVSAAIRRAIPAVAGQPIVWYLNGARAANDRTVSSAYGSAWELGLDGCRWSVAGGGRITPAGVSQPASRMATSMKVTAVAVAIIVSSFTFWKAVVPPEQQRVM